MARIHFVERDSGVGASDLVAPCIITAWGFIMLGLSVALNSLVSAPADFQTAFLSP
jgi:hypothetical protein